VARFAVTRKDVDLILAELHDDQPEALKTPLLRALLAAAMSFDSDARPLDTGPQSTTDLRLPEKHAQAFQEWLERAVMRGCDTGDRAKAEAFARVHGSDRWRLTMGRAKIPAPRSQGSDDGEHRQESRRLIAASRVLVELARAHIKATNHSIAKARRRLERSRDILQVAWLRRALLHRRTPQE
jgi:hypothetical protein